VGPWGFGVGGCTPPSAYLVVCAKLRPFGAFQFSPKLPLPFIFQWRAMKLMDATSAGVSSPWGEKEMPGHVVPTYNIPTIMIVHRWTATTLCRGVVLPCAPRNARWPIATHHPVIPSVHSASISPAPYPLVTPVHPRITDTDTVAAVVVAVHCFAARTSTSRRSRVKPRALLRCSTVRQPSTRWRS